jgi:type II secretory pathway pseudopilin PulG
MVRVQKSPQSNQQGFAYLMAMFFVVLIGISLMMIGQQWSVTMKRDREAELLFRGNRIKAAIELYGADFEVQKGKRKHRYPIALKNLTAKNPKRYLQAIYKDPMTGEDFVLIKEGQEIRGVRSSSKEVPYDQVNFKGAGTYEAIRFEAKPPSTSCTPNPVNPLLPVNCPQGAPSKDKATSPAPKSGEPSPEAEAEAMEEK